MSRSNSVANSEDTEGPSRKSRSGSKRRSKPENSTSKLVKCFSLQQSLLTLFQNRTLKDPEDAEFEIFNGLRVLACAVIILGETYFYTLKGAAL